MRKLPDGLEVSRHWNEPGKCWEFRASIRIDARFTSQVGLAMQPWSQDRIEEYMLRGIEHEAEKLLDGVREALKP